MAQSHLKTSKFQVAKVVLVNCCQGSNINSTSERFSTRDTKLSARAERLNLAWTLRAPFSGGLYGASSKLGKTAELYRRSM